MCTQKVFSSRFNSVTPSHALAPAPKINRGLGRTDIILEDILDHHMTIYLQINCNKLNKCNYRKSCNIYLLTAQYYFAIKKVLIKSGLYKHNLH